MQSRETRELVHNALQKLSPELREAVILFTVGGMFFHNLLDFLREAHAAGVPVLAVSNTAAGITDIGDYIFRNSLAETLTETEKTQGLALFCVAKPKAPKLARLLTTPRRTSPGFNSSRSSSRRRPDPRQPARGSRRTRAESGHGTSW